MAVTLYDWIFSIYPPARAAVNGRFGIVHIATVLLCVAIILRIAMCRRKDPQKRDRIICNLAALIVLFEVARRIINFSRGYDLDLHTVLYMLLPRPWCAISCWLTVMAAMFKRRYLYNAASMSSLLCALVFFAYPMVGFNHGVYLFEDVYSITTHALLLISSISMITLGQTDFRYEREGGGQARHEFSVLALVFLYAFVEIYLLKIEKDPLYFLPGNDVQSVFGLSYPSYLVVYITFILVYFNAFYLIPMALRHFKHKPLPHAA
ncbi:MAG: hypothetical protein E7625_02760 [Ruminococcaceae bacterium]|nr:hypothetical protein [Oscillospiraceae bacterium]